MVDADVLKRQAAEEAVKRVTDGMVVGLGTGSTTRFAVAAIGERLRQGELRRIVGIPTSEATAAQARELGIPLGTLAEYPRLDIAIDGADEVDPRLNLTKGWGGALVREKLVEMHADRFVVIVDESKLVSRLGTRGPLPVEVTPFGWEAQARWLAERLGCEVSRRMAGDTPYLTDNHNYILHCTFPGGIADPYAVESALAGRTGLVGHGLFLGMATDVLVAMKGGVRHLRL
ncbi:MAG: ribose-5-phosphate isomerase RpiA [Caldilineae bacterium]|nr:MAG: ribose-5-phosphate isomerase RpiA [Caldilineae bacterium]